MNIKTQFGIANDVKVEPYIEDSYTLGYINRNDDGSYDLLGFDAPIKPDPVWRFWVEHGYKNGAAEVNKAELSIEDKAIIAQMYADYITGQEVRSTLYELLKAHKGHKVVIAEYGDGDNFALEDMTTNEVIFDTDCYDLVGLDG